MKITYDKMKTELNEILLQHGFAAEKADLCATIFTNSSADGYHSHGINRFAEFVRTVQDGIVQVDAEPEKIASLGAIEKWNGNLGPGLLNAHFAMNRAIELAKAQGMACIGLQNTNHWMRGGAYGWQAAENGCIGICFTNTRPNMPSWGAKEARIGNNPLILAVPRADGHIVLDISLSLFSYGKLWQTKLNNAQLPFVGGYDKNGELTKDPAAILETERLIPTGYWKGSGLSILLDLMATLISSGKSSAQINELEAEYSLSQVFICLDATQLNPDAMHQQLVNEVIDFLSAAMPVEEGASIDYPGSRTLKRRAKSMEEGIEVNDSIWEEVMNLV